MSILPAKSQVVIIGSGIVGAAIAYYLTQKGIRDVTVLEAGEIGAQGATSVCLGGLRTQFSTAVNIRFSLISRKVFRRFEDEFDVDLIFKPYGYLFLAKTGQQWTVLKKTSNLMETLGLPVDLLTPREMVRRWPFIRVDDLTGGSYTKDDGFYGPMEALQAFVKKARQGGALFLERTPVVGFSISDQKAVGVKTQSGHEIKADIIVNAAGPWAGEVAAMAGLDLPVAPLKRYLFYTAPFDAIPDAVPMIIKTGGQPPTLRSQCRPAVAQLPIRIAPSGASVSPSPMTM